MRITWDAKARAIYIELPCEGSRQSFKQIDVHGTGQLTLDYNKRHECIGIEILNVESEPVLEKL